MRQHSSSCLAGPRSPVLRRLTRARTPRRAEPLRWDLIARIRAELAAETYLTPEKWEIALARLTSQLS